MSYRHLHTERGIGQLEAPELPPLTVRYHIDVSQRMIADGRGGSIPGVRRVEGRIFTDEMLHQYVIAGEVTLVLQDGRRWNCLLSHSDGTLVNGSGTPPFEGA